DPAADLEPSWRAGAVLPEFVTLVMADGWASPLNHHNRRLFESEVLPAYLPNQRWFGAKDRRIAQATVGGVVELPGTPNTWMLALADVGRRDDERHRYFLPLAVTWEEEGSEQRTALLPSTLALSRRGRREGAVYDAAADRAFVLGLVHAMGER